MEVKLQNGELSAYLPLVDEPLHRLIHRVRRVFDLNADGETLHDFLSADEHLGDWVRRAPGLRVPGGLGMALKLPSERCSASRSAWRGVRIWRMQ